MISIIICSKTKQLSRLFLDNIKNTIGTSYELIMVDNSNGTYSICEAYQIGIEKSTGQFWCFMHDDIIFYSNNWGLQVLDIFKNNPKIGLVGIAGAEIKTKMASAWWDCDSIFKHIHIIQHFPDKKKELISLGWQYENQIKDVVVIDGVFMVAIKDQRFSFKNVNLGFHNYDLFISAYYHNLNYKIVVTNSVLLEHLSFGNVNKKWAESACTFYKSYNFLLPLKTAKIDDNLLTKLELRNGYNFMQKLVDNKLYKDFFIFWCHIFRIKFFSIYHWKILQLLFQKSLK